uniref:Chloride channel protein 2 n=1 Tax=Aceria tosichella TaxID=561515 RepID=A0A6G1SEG5_9ACAR
MDKLWRRVRLLATGKERSGDSSDQLPEKQQEKTQPNQTTPADEQQTGERHQTKNQSSNSFGAGKPIGNSKHDSAQQQQKRTNEDQAVELDEDENENEECRRKQNAKLDDEPAQGDDNTNRLTQVPAAQPPPTSFYDCLTPMTRSRLNTLAQIGEDWLYLALLGIIMALLSLFMDSMITMFLSTRIWLSEEMSEQNLFLEYLAWCLVPILLVTFSTGFVHLCSPTAIGSGIPEMKTILRGVVLNEYLTFRTLIAKIVGLTFTLGSGLPLGKEGPSVHMASIVATLLSKLVASFQGIYENESRTSEMLSAACAVMLRA